MGADCSGIVAPIHGLRELGIPHQHLFGSEVYAGPRSVIEANTKPKALFHSVLDADLAPVASATAVTSSVGAWDWRRMESRASTLCEFSIP